MGDIPFGAEGGSEAPGSHLLPDGNPDLLGCHRDGVIINVIPILFRIEASANYSAIIIML